MNRHIFAVLLGLFTAIATGGDTLAAARGDCDRACLKAHVDSYLAAMQARDSSRISVADHLRLTENTNALELGQGLWATMTGLGSYRVYFYDPETGQAGFYGTIRENGNGAIIVLRLKITQGRISEAEVLVRRNPTEAAALESKGAPDPLWEKSLDPDDRPSREELIRAADLYLEGILHSDGDRVPFADDCNRILNGSQDTNNPDYKGWMFGSFNPSALDCRDNTSARVFTSITSIEPRRYPVIDRERGTVFGVFMFRHRGNVTTTTIPGIGLVQLPARLQVPFDTGVAELFKIERGKIRRIEGLVIPFPYMQSDGWTPAAKQK